MTSFASAQLPVRMLSLFAVAAAAGMSQGAMAEDKAATPTAPAAFSMNGYWRAQFNTAANPTLEASDTQSTTAAPVSRHAQTANYWNLDLSKSTEGGPSYFIELNGALPNSAGAAFGPGIEELYAKMPAGDGMTVWAGLREMEDSRERLIDMTGPFNKFVYGIGIEAGAAKVSLSMDKATQVRPGTVVPPAVPGTAAPAAATVATKDLSILGSYEVPVSDTLKVRPVILLTMHGGIPENTVTKAKAVKGSTEFKVGAVVNHGTGSINNGQATVWFHSAPTDKSGETSGANSTVGILHSSAWDLGMAGVLTGFSLESMSYKDKMPVFKVDGGAIVPDGTNTTTSTMKVSIGAQPVYYVTDHFHAALDFNYALTTKKVAASDANLLALTPILRYALAKNPVGTPQIYTSLTYGKYDAKVKKATNGEATDSLITTQTGMEVWF